jgi:hypothetical protein
MVERVIIRKSFTTLWSTRFNDESQLLISEFEVFNLIQSFSEKKLPVLDSDEESISIFVFTDFIGKFVYTDYDYHGDRIYFDDAKCLHWLIENSTDLNTLKQQYEIVQTTSKYLYPTYTYSNVTGLVPYKHHNMRPTQ